MAQGKLKTAQGYIRAWIANGGRFDLNDVADRMGVTLELNFVRDALLEILDDEELFDIDFERFLEEKASKEKKFPCSDWLKELTDRYFS